MNDYYAILKVQQGRIRAAMHAMEIKTAAELSRRTGISQPHLGRLLNFKMSPYDKKTGRWKKTVLKVSEVLCVTPEELFPEHLQHEVLTNEIAAFVEQAQLGSLGTTQLGPCEVMEEDETRNVVEAVLATLSERERDVLHERFWDKCAYQKMGVQHNLTAERMRQIENRALRKLRHPARLQTLAGVCPF